MELQHKKMTTKAIRELMAFEDDWAIKVHIARKTSREVYLKSENKTEVMRLFFQDSEGSIIQATLFNEVIDKFNEALECGKSYIICNGNVRPVKQYYDNANDKIKISFTHATLVEEMDERIPYTIRDTYVNFKNIESISRERRLMAVIGMVIRVRPAIVINLKNGKNKTTKKREIILMDHLHTTIKLDLWGDLACNEGEIIEEMVRLRPIIAALNVLAEHYLEELKLSTSHVSIIEINPADEQSNIFEKRFDDFSNGRGMDIEIPPSKRMTESIEQSLAHIIASNVNEKYCTFVGKVVKVLSKHTMWYDKCSKCNKTVYPERTNTTVICCNKKNSSFTRNYLVKLIITDGKQEVYATLFDAVEAIVGCPVKYFANSILTNKHENVYYKNLMSSQEKKYKFLVNMDNKRAQERANKRIIVEEVLKIDSEPFGEGTSSQKRKLEIQN